MDLLPTQDIGDTDFNSEEEEHLAAWGRLFPLGCSFVAKGLFVCKSAGVDHYLASKTQLCQ